MLSIHHLPMLPLAWAPQGLLIARKWAELHKDTAPREDAVGSFLL